MTVRRRVPAAALGLAVAVGCALATFVLHGVFVGTAAGQVVDQAVLDRATGLPLTVAEVAEGLLTQLTVPLALLGCVLVLTVSVVRRSPWHAVGALLVVAGANVTTQVLKLYVFERPDLLELGAPNSLPSGHTTIVASIALGLVFTAPPAMRLPAAVIGLGASLLVGTATIVVGWHRLSDVAAALLVSVAWAGVALALVVLRPRTLGRRGRRRVTV